MSAKTINARTPTVRLAGRFNSERSAGGASLRTARPTAAPTTMAPIWPHAEGNRESDRRRNHRQGGTLTVRRKRSCHTQDGQSHDRHRGDFQARGASLHRLARRGKPVGEQTSASADGSVKAVQAASAPR